MPYSKNPFLPKLRMQTVNLVRLHGWTVRAAARYVGVSPGTVSKWLARGLPMRPTEPIATRSSRPLSNPGRIAPAVEAAIVEERERTHRCGQVIHHVLEQRGIGVSLATVHRVLKRQGLISRDKRWYHRPARFPRPDVAAPGDLVELDTIHVAPPRGRTELYVYTLLDVWSRWAWAWASLRIGTALSAGFVERAQSRASFTFRALQSDHGSEFSKMFSAQVGIPHRLIHVRSPNEQGHLERFNRTVQDECLRVLPLDPAGYNRALARYLTHYNTSRPHMGIDFQTPTAKLATVFPRL